MDTMSPADLNRYNRLYRNLPATTQGRIRRAVQLIELGWCKTRVFDDCFEMGDGEAVLRGLLKQVADKPHLKAALIQQGFWSPDWERRLQQNEQLCLL